MILIHNLNQPPGCKFCQYLVQVNINLFACKKKENINKYINNKIEFCPSFSSNDNSTIKIAINDIKIEDVNL